jgi:hypothetical protein
MVTPGRRRRAVSVLVERFGVSERRACRVVGQHRSTRRRSALSDPSSRREAAFEASPLRAEPSPSGMAQGPRRGASRGLGRESQEAPPPVA